MTEMPVRPLEPRRPIFARHAASLLVVRAGAAGPEVLMGVRGAGHRFVPNRLVFPGGAVDPDDHKAAAATEPRPDLLALLQRRARPRLARALAVAAARELAEETGVSLGTPPRLDQMDYLCRAVTPPHLPIRFNARFLVVPAEAAEGEHADSRELHGVRYYTADELLHIDLMGVTRWVIEMLLAWLKMPEATRRDAERLDVFRGERARRDR